MNELPWWKNRKFTMPLISAVATLALTIFQQALPDVAMTQTQLNNLLNWIWAAGLAVAGGDMVFDWLGLLSDVLGTSKEIIDANRPANG